MNIMILFKLLYLEKNHKMILCQNDGRSNQSGCHAINILCKYNYKSVYYKTIRQCKEINYNHNFH